MSRSPTSFAFNDVVGLDLFFLHTYEKHTLPAMNIVCWGTGLQRVIHLRDQSGENLRNAYRHNRLRSYGRPRVLVIDQQRSLCSGIFAEKVESDGTRLGVTPLEAPWRNGKTERAGRDWKEDYYKMTQDDSEAQTWTDFEKDCDAVNQARASKINDRGKSAYQHVFGKNPPQMGDAVLESRPGRSEPAADRRIGTGTINDYETHCPTSKPGTGSQTSIELCTTQRNTTRANCTLDTSLVLETWSDRSKKNNQRFLAPGCSNKQHIGHGLDCIPWFCGQVCTIPGKTVYRRDDEAAHEHISEHMRDLGERLLHEGDFSYEDITGQGEPPVDSSPAPGENTAIQRKTQTEQSRRTISSNCKQKS